MLCLDSFFFFVCVSITDFWFVVTMRFLYSSLYMYMIVLSCRSLNFKCPWLGWFMGPALCECCWLLVSGAWSQGSRLEPQGAVGLMLAHWWTESGSRRLWGCCPLHWWVKPGPGISARLLAGRAGSWSLATGPRGPRAGVRSLLGVGGPGS